MRNLLGQEKVHHLTTETAEADQVVLSPLDRDKVQKLDAVLCITSKDI